MLERIDPKILSNTLKLTALGHLERYNKALDLIKSDFKILDAGCGCGYGSKMMSALADKIIGIDLSIKAINYAHKNYNSKNISYIQSDLETADFSVYGKFNLITFFEVIEHLKTPINVLTRMNKQLLPNGYLLLSTPNSENTAHNNKYHINEYSKQELETLLTNSGFKIIELSGQYPLIGTLYGLASKLMNHQVDNNKQNPLSRLTDLLPIPNAFAKLYRSKLAINTSLNLYVIAQRN